MRGQAAGAGRPFVRWWRWRAGEPRGARDGQGPASRGAPETGRGELALLPAPCLMWSRPCTLPSRCMWQVTGPGGMPLDIYEVSMTLRDYHRKCAKCGRNEEQLAAAQQAQQPGPSTSAQAPTHKHLLRTCTACRRVWYCGVECQRAHWSTHKPVCKRYQRHDDEEEEEEEEAEGEEVRRRQLCCCVRRLECRAGVWPVATPAAAWPVQVEQAVPLRSLVLDSSPPRLATAGRGGGGGGGGRGGQQQPAVRRLRQACRGGAAAA